MAMKGRKYFEENFEPNKLMDGLERWLTELTEHKE
jgi:hypothetical protein